MIVIGIVGKKYAGKDTLAEMIIRKSAMDRKYSIRMGFADTLKQEICTAINSVNALSGGPTHPPITPAFINLNKEKFRSILQWWGTDYRRNECSKNYWIDATLRRIKNLNDSMLQYVLFPDVRFANEAQMIKQLNGYLVRIYRKIDYVPDLHASETELDTIKSEYQIENNQSLAELRVEALKLLDTISQTEKKKQPNEVIA